MAARPAADDSRRQRGVLKLFAQRAVDWQNRGQFFAIAAQLMRRILVDHARKALRDRRGPGAVHVALDDALGVATETPVDAVDALALDRALSKLERLDAAQGRIVELRFFGGLTVEEAALVTGVSPATVKREWALAKDSCSASFPTRRRALTRSGERTERPQPWARATCARSGRRRTSVRGMRREERDWLVGGRRRPCGGV